MRIGRNLSLICLILLHGALARGQATPPSLSNVSVQKEAANSPDRYSGAATESYERRSAVALQTSCAPQCAQFTSRYSAVVNADNDSGYYDHTEGLDSDYSIHFQVIAQGSYRLRVDSSLSGDLNLVDDGGYAADALIGDVTGSGAVPARGSLSLVTSAVAGGDAQPPCNGQHNCSITISKSASARISGASHGLPVDYALRFKWSQHARTHPLDEPEFKDYGLEAAVRLGGTSQNPLESASDYPGSPPRNNKAADGHFVSVQLIPPNDECPDATVISSTPFANIQDTSGADSVRVPGPNTLLDPSLSCGNPSLPPASL